MPIQPMSNCPRCGDPKSFHLPREGCTAMRRTASGFVRCRCPGRWSLRSLVEMKVAPETCQDSLAIAPATMKETEGGLATPPGEEDPNRRSGVRLPFHDNRRAGLGEAFAAFLVGMLIGALFSAAILSFLSGVHP